MKIATWNIKYGSKINNIQESIGKDVDIIVLNEFRNNQWGNNILNSLADYQIFVPKNEHNNGFSTIIASKQNIENNFSILESSDNDLSTRWIECYLPKIDLRILGVHIPGKFPDRKGPFWEKVIEYAKRTSDEQVLIIGDFNTGLDSDAQGSKFILSHYFETLVNDLGWKDAWKQFHPDEVEYSYLSNSKNGFRIDHAIVSPKLLGKVKNAYYSHWQREEGLSDHSPLFVELDM